MSIRNANANLKARQRRSIDMPAGRPTKYKEEYGELVYKLCLLGATDSDMADIIGVTEQTFNNWKTDHPEFFESIKRGKEIADANVASRLYERAMGYAHPEDKIFNNQGKEMVVPTIKHYPPDPTAAIFWLKNRQRANWRDKQDIEHSGNVTVETVNYAGSSTK